MGSWAYLESQIAAHTEAQRAEGNACAQLQLASLRARSLSGSFGDIFSFVAARTNVEQNRRGNEVEGADISPIIRRLLGGNSVHY